MLKSHSLLMLFLVPACVAASPQPLFDSHLHYNAEHATSYGPAQIIAILRDNGVPRAVVTGSPPEQALTLYRQAPERVVPLLGIYRTAADKADWTDNATLPGRVAAQLQQGPWRGIGELHLFAEQRHSPVFLQLVTLATQRDLPLLMHCDPAVIDRLYEHAPDATVIWAHAGAYPYPPLLRDYLARYPRLHVDLSVRDERIAPGGALLPAWEDLLLEFPDRFLLGVDTFRTERWGDYGHVAARIRQWLAGLPDDVAAQLARDNAQRLFAGGDPR